MLLHLRFILVTWAVVITGQSAFASSDSKYKPETWLFVDRYSPVEKNETMDLDFKLRQRAQSFENSAESSFLYTIEGTPKFKYQLNNFITFNSEVSINSRIGSVQSRFGDLRSRSAIIIRDTRFKFYRQTESKEGDARYNSYLSVGAIDQGGHHGYFDNFVSRRALPGVEERFLYEKDLKRDTLVLDFKGFQGIPTAQSNTLNFAEKETTPVFLSANIGATYKREKSKNNFYLSANYGLFSFSGLPAVIADESRIYGNTVDFIGAAAEFRYGFKGWTAGWETGYARGRYEFKLGVKMLQNLDAPDKRNQAQMSFASIGYVASRNLKLKFQPMTFFTESDASIASYNQLAGHNNREGYGFRFTVDLPRKKFKLKFNYAHSDLIEENNLQLKQDFFGFSLEYKNDFI